MKTLHYHLATLLSAIFVLSFSPTAQATFPDQSMAYWTLSVSTGRPDPEYVQASDLIREKKYEEAMVILKQKERQAKTHGERANAIILKSFLLNEMGKYWEALAAMKTGYQMENQHPAIYFGYCQIYRNLGVAELSDRACKISSEQNLGNPAPLYEQAQTLMALGKMKEANRKLAKAAKLDPKNSIYPYQRGLIYSYFNNFDDAEKSFKESLSINPDDLDSAYQLAYIHAVNGKPELSRKLIKRIVDSKTHHPKKESAKILLDYLDKNAADKLPQKNVPHKYHLSRSKSLYKSGQYGLALLEIQTAAQLKPDDPKIQEILVGLSGILLRMETAAAAVTHLIELAEKANDLILQARGYQKLGDIKVIQGKLEEAKQYFEKAITLGDPNNLAKTSLAEFPVDLKKFKGRDELLQKCVALISGLERQQKLSPHLCVDPVEGLNRQGEVFAHYGMYQRAIALYATVLQMNPNHILSKLNASAAHYKSGKPERAISILESILITHPNHEFIETHRLLLAQAYVEKKDLDSGLKNLEELIKLNPGFKKVIQSDPVFDSLREMEGYKKLFE